MELPCWVISVIQQTYLLKIRISPESVSCRARLEKTNNQTKKKKRHNAQFITVVSGSFHTVTLVIYTCRSWTPESHEIICGFGGESKATLRNNLKRLLRVADFTHNFDEINNVCNVWTMCLSTFRLGDCYIPMILFGLSLERLHFLALFSANSNQQDPTTERGFSLHTVHQSRSIKCESMQWL